MNDADLAALDKKAQENLDLVFSAVPSSVIRKPSILTIYFAPHRAKVTLAPPELQFEWLFQHYNEVRASRSPLS